MNSRRHARLRKQQHVRRLMKPIRRATENAHAEFAMGITSYEDALRSVVDSIKAAMARTVADLVADALARDLIKKSKRSHLRAVTRTR